MLIEGTQKLEISAFHDGQLDHHQEDLVACEVPVALVYNGISHVVMMATPKDLIYFAIGFSLAEGIIQSPRDIYGIDIETQDTGIEVRVELASRCFMQLKEKRRNLTGRTGCGVCGTEQIAQVLQPLNPLANTAQLNLHDVCKALDYLKQVEVIGRETGCTHAAVWLDLKGQLIAGFEDIGRHVALDKLLGYRAKQPVQQGVILVSSRASYEIVQKVAHCGVEILLAVSAPTSLAVDIAKRVDLSLAGFFRGNKAVIYHDSGRFKIEAAVI